MTTEPVEPDDGQDPEPPDVALALLVALDLLEDLRDHLDPNRVDGDCDDLLLRLPAVIKVVRMVRERTER